MACLWVYIIESLNFLFQTPEELAQSPGDSPVVFPMKLDECLALVIYDKVKQQLWIRVGICIRKFDRAKGGSKQGEKGCQKRLRFPIDATTFCHSGDVAGTPRWFVFPQLRKGLVHTPWCLLQLGLAALPSADTWCLAGLHV